MNTEAEIEGMHLQAKKEKVARATKSQEKHETDSPSRSPKRTNPTDTLVLDIKPKEM